MDLEPLQKDPVDQLPAVIEPGSIKFTLWTSAMGGDSVAHDISFTWHGQHTAEWFQDISTVNGLSPGSSSPASGIVSWPDGNDVLLTYTWSDLGIQGHDRLPGAAPTSNDAQGAKDPQQWIRLGEALLNFVLLDLGAGRDTPEEWSAEYHDLAQDTVVDFHELFRAYLDSADSDGVLPDFDGWISNAVTAGTYERLGNE
jgi:hypothetical protein